MQDLGLGWDEFSTPATLCLLHLIGGNHTTIRTRIDVTQLFIRSEARNKTIRNFLNSTVIYGTFFSSYDE